MRPELSGEKLLIETKIRIDGVENGVSVYKFELVLEFSLGP
jgi:hypothetical protein